MSEADHPHSSISAMPRAPEQQVSEGAREGIPKLRFGSRLRGLELCCKAGGSGKGYADAGFEMVGVDQYRQPRYPFEFIQADALSLGPDWIRRNFDFVHASPPCQFATPLKHAPNAKRHVNLIPDIRRLLKQTGLPYVIENVEEAVEHLIDPIILCGTMFGLGAQGCELQRHRAFESNIKLRPPMPCQHSGGAVIGVYGGHARNRSAKHGGRGTRDKWIGGHKAAASEALGIDWMTLDELSEAIPPLYTQWLGMQVGAAIRTQARAA